MAKGKKAGKESDKKAAQRAAKAAAAEKKSAKRVLKESSKKKKRGGEEEDEEEWEEDIDTLLQAFAQKDLIETERHFLNLGPVPPPYRAHATLAWSHEASDPSDNATVRENELLLFGGETYD